MKKIRIVVMLLCCMIGSLTLTGCGMTKELKDAYNKMAIGDKENEINGYTMNLKLFGVYKEQKVNTAIRVSNYMNKDFKVIVDNTTYYLIDGAKYKSTESDLDRFSSSQKYNFNEDTARDTVKYDEIDEDIPFINTNSYLATLKNVRADDKPLTEKIGDYEYKTYTYSANKNNMASLLKDTVLKDIVFETNVPAKVWIDSEGYVYKIEYSLSSGLKSNSTLTLTAYFSGVNMAKQIILDNFS